MWRRRIHLLCLILTGMLPAAGPALAQAPTPGGANASAAGPRESASAERERLRGELTRVQAEIDRLKSSDRGLRTDYLLRARLADAEALARRLTELDVQLKPRVDPAATRAADAIAPAIHDEAAPSPTDGPAELEAKADILTDEARRAQAQAVALQSRIEQVRGRRELHRRARQLENDPFAPLEGSRRRLATGSASASSSASSHDTAQGGGNRTVVVTPGPGPPTPGAPSAAAATPSSPSSSAPTPVTPAAAPAAAAQVHDVLDPGAPAQARRIDAGLSPTADLESMERALAGLNARAQRLDAQAKALRVRAHAH